MRRRQGSVEGQYHEPDEHLFDDFPHALLSDLSLPFVSGKIYAGLHHTARPRRRGDRMKPERITNTKCQTRPVFDTFSARSADSTGLKMIRITRGASFDHLVGAGE